MNYTIEEIIKLLNEALALAQSVDHFKEAEVILTCEQMRGQGFVLRQQLHEYGNSDIITGTHQEVGDQLASIKKNSWFRTA
tara:strand:+ start:4440 stop:4682 length:243 start_codon:yes stop_codon:yes gene_type:complete